MIDEKYKFDGILFDMDGTILDTIPLIIESFQFAYKKHFGHVVDEKEILAGIGVPLEDVFSKLSPEESKSIIKTYTDYNHQLLPSHIGLFVGIIELLEHLKYTGMKTGIVTSKRTDSAIASLKPFNLLKYFDLIQAKEATKKHKPDPEPLIKAMHDLDLTDPRRVVYVGDSVHDLLCAKNAGCKAAIVDWTRMPKEDLLKHNPDIWINKAMDLYDWVVNK